MGPRLAGKFGSDGGSPPPEAAIQSDAWLSSLKLWQAFFSLLTEPETVAAVFQGIRTPSEIVLRLAQAGWGGYAHMHRQWLERWEVDGNPSSAHDLEDLEKDISKICKDLFEKDFSRLLDMAHLRLTFLTQERLDQATGKFNHFQGAMAEFIRMVFLPVKKSLRSMGGVGEIGKHKSPEDFKEYYKEWLKMLEGYYMTLLQSAEYVQTLVYTLNALQDFIIAKDALLTETMEALSSPSQRDLDALYREMYLLKKSMKEMAKKKGQTEPSSGQTDGPN
jgi:hypothetical protein